MDRPLAPNSVFLAPLLAESLRFRRFAYRAVTLVSVVAVVLVPLGAFSLSRVLGGWTASGERVFAVGQAPQVRWIDAPRISARMIHDETRWNVPNGRPIGDPVSSPVLASEVEDSIAVFVGAGDPEPTAARSGGAMLGESRALLLSHSVHAPQYIP